MKRKCLMMKYHPAKKEIEFQWCIDGRKEALDPDSRLKKYMNEKGTFVLQDYGRAFFDDIAAAFTGEKTANVHVTTTKLDYEDFVQMVDFYNATSANCKINLTDFVELPDMTATYEEVRKYGLQAMSILEDHAQNLCCGIDIQHDNARECADNFVRKINEEIQNIKSSIDNLSDNRVSLCFVGVYSAGKSALINAILGYRILPESIKSETAKMFTISSPKPGENIKIVFTISDKPAEIEWNESIKSFVFSEGPSESEIRTGIQEVINNVAKLPNKHEQIYQILSHLNGCEVGEISSDITILFPIPLDNEKVQFVIYDTPGTDGNYVEHKKILDEALKVQSQSILIFVAKPDSLEGEGNNILLDRLKEAKTNSRTNIDLGRSLFVINKADAVTDSVRVNLQNQTIICKENSDLSIKLTDKKLFFVSALYGYAARAKANGIETDTDKGLFTAGKYLLETKDAPMSFCYRQNRYATSQMATERMIKRCDEAFAAAKNENDKLSISSGLYALEQEIVQYGEKYADAVKAYAIIRSVECALEKLKQEIDLLKTANKEDISTIEKEIAKLKEVLESAIAQTLTDKQIQPNELPLDDRKALKIDLGSSFSNIIEPIEEHLHEKLPGIIFGFGPARVNDEVKNSIKEEIDGTFQSFTNEFVSTRNILLEQHGVSCVAEVQKVISKNGEISEAAKKYLLTIPAPSIKELKLTTDVDKIFDRNSHSIPILSLFDQNQKIINKQNFILQVTIKLKSEITEMCNDYCKDYCDSLNIVVEKVSDDFQSRLAEYSLTLGALVQDRDAMIKIGDRMQAASDALGKCLEELDGIIWKVRKND